MTREHSSLTQAQRREDIPAFDRYLSLCMEFTIFPQVPAYSHHIFGMAPGERRDTQRLAGERVDLLGHHTTWQRMLTRPCQQRQRLVQFIDVAGARDTVLRQPERTDKPGIALRL